MVDGPVATLSTGNEMGRARVHRAANPLKMWSRFSACGWCSRRAGPFFPQAGQSDVLDLVRGLQL